MSNVVQKLEQDGAELGKFARAVVAKRIVVVAVVAAVLQLLVGYHVITPGVSGDVTKYINDLIDVLAVISGILFAQRGVTPTSDPRNDTGVALVPVTRVQALIANALSQAAGENVPAVEEPETPAVALDPEVPAVDPDAVAVEPNGSNPDAEKAEPAATAPEATEPAATPAAPTA